MDRGAWTNWARVAHCSPYNLSSCAVLVRKFRKRWGAQWTKVAQLPTQRSASDADARCGHESREVVQTACAAAHFGPGPQNGQKCSESSAYACALFESRSFHTKFAEANL